MSEGNHDRVRGKPRQPGEDAASTFRPNPAAKRPQRPDPIEDLEPESDSEAGATLPPTRSSPGRSNPRTGRPAGAEPNEPASRVKAMGETLLIGRVRAGNLAVFCRQLGVYLDSGVGILKALASLRKQASGTAMGPVAERLAESVKKGNSLAEAFAQEDQAFDKLAVSMIRVAEMRGGLPETLKSLGAHYDARQRFWRQARSAMIYPTAVILIALAVAGLLTIFVLPTFVSILEDLVRDKGIDLPGPTRLLMAITNFIKNAGWWVIPLVLVGTIFGLTYAYKRKASKWWIDSLIVRLPGLGGLVQLIDHGRFARTLGDLLGAGVDMNQSLKLSADVLQFEPNRDAITQARVDVKKGGELAPTLRRSRRFAPDLLAFVETGEETGQLPESLLRVAKDYEERADGLIKNIGSVIQPLLMIVIGGIVGFIAVAFLMAYAAVLMSLLGGV